MKTFQERLKLLIDKLADGKHTVFAKKCGIPPGTFQAYVDSGTIPKGEQLSKIGSVYRINLNWLLLGEGEPFIQGAGEGKIPETGKMEPFTNDAVRMVEEAIQEAGVSVTETQKQNLVSIIREEMKILAFQVVRALKRGTIREYKP